MESRLKIETRHQTLEVWKSDLVDYFAWLLGKDILELQKTNKPEERARAAELQERPENLKKPDYSKWVVVGGLWWEGVVGVWWW